MQARWALIALALAAAVVPLPDEWIEAWYSTSLYPYGQAAITSLSNLVPIALIDVLLVVVAIGWLVALVGDSRRLAWRRTAWRALLRTATVASLLYLAFLAAWGLNYRRVPLEDRLQLSSRGVTPDAAERLARAAVAELNRLYRPANERPALADDRIDATLPPALASVQRQLDAPRAIVPARPKRSLLDAYFRAASVDGMTDPWFLETLTLSTLLPFERPMVIAHEWAHLAGFADEGEANFVGWLACLRADDAARYSAWLFLYAEAASALDDGQRRDVIARLADGPRADLRAINARIAAHVNVVVSDVGWGLYDQYLKANGIERGRRSYTDVVRLVLGTSLGADALATASTVSGNAANPDVNAATPPAGQPPAPLPARQTP